MGTKCKNCGSSITPIQEVGPGFGGKGWCVYCEDSMPKPKDARIAALKSALAKAEEAIRKADHELAWATCMMAEGVEFYTLREVFHAAQKDAMKAHQTLNSALAAIKEAK